MVRVESARKDLDKILTQRVEYSRVTSDVVDYATGDREETNEVFEIVAQCSITQETDQKVELGILEQGDLTASLKHKYEEDVYGQQINPVLVPSPRDKIKYLDRWFTIRNATPVSSEDNAVIGYDVNAVKSDGEN